RGTGVVGGALATTLARAEVEAIVLDGFFAAVPADARPRPSADLAAREWGLPFAAEPEVTRHVAEFLGRQREPAGQAELALARPDAILFNGGALEPHVVRERLCAVVGSWHAPAGDWQPAELEAESLQLAVARGGRKLADRVLPVHLEVRLTEIGTLELWCRSRETEHRWRLEFRLRDTVAGAEPAPPADAAVIVDPGRIEAASALLRAAFEGPDDPVAVTRRLVVTLDAGRDAGPLG